MYYIIWITCKNNIFVVHVYMYKSVLYICFGTFNRFKQIAFKVHFLYVAI